jgi:hypothetical protein
MIKLPTFTKAGMVCKNELKIMYSLFAFLSSLSTLQTLSILNTESYWVTGFLLIIPYMPPNTTIKSKLFHPFEKYVFLYAINLSAHSQIKIALKTSETYSINFWNSVLIPTQTKVKITAFKIMINMINGSKYLCSHNKMQYFLNANWVIILFSGFTL